MGVGSKINKLRMRSGKTQQEIADLLNVDRRTYAKWEDESSEIKTSLIPKIAEIFGVEIPELFTNEKNIEIKDSFRDNKNSNNAVIVMITDKEVVDKVLNLLGNI